MADEVFDAALARYLCQLGTVSVAQVEAARQAQAAQAGSDISLAAALVQLQYLNKAQRAKAEQEVKGRLQSTHIGQYRLLRKLGEGSMGAVYLAEDGVAQRNVALKVLPRKHCNDPHFLMRFQREVRAAGSLNHANIAVAYTAGEDAGQHFVVMEYCEGESLDRIIKRSQALLWNQALQIVLQVANGLKCAHDQDVLHREITPSHIMVSDAGVAKLLNTGLPRIPTPYDRASGMQGGMTPATCYISPEQARGDGEIDGRSDIYSLGATFYHMLTGVAPFAGAAAAMIAAKRLNEQLPNPQDVRDGVPPGVIQVVHKMMAREPADRYQNCAELLDDIELVLGGRAPASQAIDAAKSSVAAATGTRAAGGPQRQSGAARRATKTGGLERVPSTASAQSVSARPRISSARVAEAGVAESLSAPSPKMAYLLVGGGVALLALGLVLAFGRRSQPASDAHKAVAAAQPVRADETPKPAPVQPARPAQPGAGSGQTEEVKRPALAVPRPAPPETPKPEIPVPKPETPGPTPDVRLPAPETDKPKPELQTPKPETPPPQPAVPVVRGWRPVFDGHTADCLRGGGRGAWRVDNGAIVNVPGTNDAAQTVQQFGDGEIRIRYEASGNDRMFFAIRQSDGGTYKFLPSGAQMVAAAGTPHELIFSCHGDTVTATLNGQQVAVSASGGPRTGALQINAQGGSMRILSIEQGDAAADASAPAPALAPKPETGKFIPWQPIFDGQTADCLLEQGQGAWRAENGALVNVAGVQKAVPTAKEFTDGQIRIRFEVSGVKYMDIKVRQRPEGGICATFDKPQLETMGNKPQELIFTCRGTDVTATLNGQPLPLGGEARPLKGRVRFYVGNGTLRILSLESRELLPDGTAATLSAAPPAPVFPVIVEERVRIAMRTSDRAFETLAKTDLDPASRLDQALRLAKSNAAPELQPLADILQKAQALYEQAAANIAKRPPAESVYIEKLKLTGTIAGVSDGKALIKSQGVEMPVDVALLPQAVFMKALAFDESKPAGIADKAAWFVGMGNLDGAQQALKRLKKEDVPSWAALFEHRAAWARLAKFEASVNAAEAALKNSKTADALSALNALKKDYPDLVEANKERIASLLGQAEGAK